MFCAKCGTENSNESRFCANCGAPLGQPTEPAYGQPGPAQQPYPPTQPYQQPPYQPPYQQPPAQQPNGPWDAPKPAANKKLIAIIIAAVVVVAAIVVALVLLLGGGSSSNPEAVVENFLDALVDGDSAGMRECIHPNMRGEMDVSEFDSLLDMGSMGIEFSFDVGDATEVKKSEASDYFEEWAEDYDIPEEDFEALYRVEVTMELTAFGQTQRETTEAPVVMIDGQCYIAPDD